MHKGKVVDAREYRARRARRHMEQYGYCDIKDAKAAYGPIQQGYTVPMPSDSWLTDKKEE